MTVQRLSVMMMTKLTKYYFESIACVSDCTVSGSTVASGQSPSYCLDLSSVLHSKIQDST
jgi:hypothetical protein